MTEEHLIFLGACALLAPIYQKREALAFSLRAEQIKDAVSQVRDIYKSTHARDRDHQ